MWGERFLAVWIAAILVCGAVSFHTQSPLAALHCPPYKAQTNSQSYQEGCASFDVLFARSVSDLRAGIGGFIERNRDDITAISTFVVAIFTGTLWWVTWGMVGIARDQRTDMLRSIEAAEKAAKAASLSAQAAVSVEIPHLWVHDIEPVAHTKDDIKWLKEFQVRVFIQNYGRTPAFIDDIAVLWNIGSEMPETPDYYVRGNRIDPVIIAGGGVHAHKEQFIHAFPGFNAEELERLGPRGLGLNIYGVIRFRDFLGKNHTRGFIYAWTDFERFGVKAEFIDAGRIYPAYDYQT